MVKGVDRGREGLSLPSLRTVRAVFPHTALQSVVSSSGLARLQLGLHLVNSPNSAKDTCPLTPLPSAANIRSVQTSRSTHAHWAGPDSAYLAPRGTLAVSLSLSFMSFLLVSTFLPPLAHAVFLFRTSQAALCSL